MATILRSPIGSGFWLEPRAAASYLRARAAGMPAGLTSAGRDWEQQMRLYDGWVAQREGFNFALHPSKSLHCLGRAVDLGGDVNNPATARGWMRKHGRAYGWTPVTNEPWHFEYNAANDKHQEDDMPTAEEIADAVWNRQSADGRSLGALLVGMPAAVWAEKVGKPDTASMTYDAAGTLLALTATRSYKAAVRAQDLLNSGADVDVDALAEALNETLGESVAKALAAKLAN